MGKLDNRVAVITGGSNSIGLAMAKLFAAERSPIREQGNHPMTFITTTMETIP